MNDRFSFFDIIAYIIPGIVGLILAFRILHFFFYISNFNIGFFLQWYGIIVMILIGYILGHLFQTIAKNIFGNRLYYSNTLLLDRDKHYSNNLKKRIIDAYTILFKDKSLAKSIDTANDSASNKDSDKIIRESFDLSYSLVNQREMAVSSEIFISLYYFCQGMVVVSLAWLIDACIELYMRRPMTSETIIQFTSPIVSLAIFGCALISIWLFCVRAKYFSKHFADSVYRSLLCMLVKKEN